MPLDGNAASFTAFLAGCDARVARAQPKHKVDLRALRLRDLVNLLRRQFGEQLPGDAAGEMAMFVLAHHLAFLPGDQRKRISRAIDDWAPWMDAYERDKLISKVTAKPRRFTAAVLGRKLGLTWAVRTELRITTIGAVDGPSPEERRRQRDRAKKRRKRRPRDEYLASHAGSEAKRKPWEDLGVSRRTYYRAKAAGGLSELHGKANDTGCVPRHINLPGEGDAPGVTVPGARAHPPVWCLNEQAITILDGRHGYQQAQAALCCEAGSGTHPVSMERAPP